MSISIPYKKYKHVLEYPRYEIGVFDCFSVVRDVLKSAYGVVMPNYARPMHFFVPELNLANLISAEDYLFDREALSVNIMQPGDILSFKVNCATVNHVGIYLGNNLFLHQMLDCIPREENLSLAWMRRLSRVQYHRDVDQKRVKVDIIDLMTNYKKDTFYVEQ